MGLGRRTFAPGEVLTASNVMNYLQDQAVMSFAGTAARGSAIGTAVQEGMVSYLQDTNDVQVYNGSAWVTLGPSNQILQAVSFSTSTPFATSSATYVDSGLSVSITPKFSTSKLVIFVTQPVTNDASGGGANLALFRDSTQIAVIAAVFGFNMPAYYRGVQSSIVIETAGSTTARTYKTQIAKGTGAGNVASSYDSTTSTIIVWEIAA